MKFTSWAGHIALMEKHGMILIPFLLAFAAILQIVGGILIILNRFTCIAALVLAGLVLVININLHDFWHYSGVEGAHEMQNFIKNLAIFAGLLILASSTWEQTFQTRIQRNS
ncbi:hypothetical protein VH1709_contig00248-0001 [Vibrio harveyi]|nr:hypothetical protein VH1709_contig00248-0001 [Vibrio harveyi]GEA24890.1 membrane protein [Vibrio harveyi]